MSFITNQLWMVMGILGLSGDRIDISNYFVKQKNGLERDRFLNSKSKKFIYYKVENNKVV